MKVANYKTGKVGWVLEYNESKVDAGIAARIGGNIAGNNETIERILNHFSLQRDTANLKNRFIHLKLSLSPMDNISSKTFRKLSAKVLSELGYENNPYIAYRHYDTNHPHVHIILCRVTFDGKLIRDSYDGLKLKKLEQQLDHEFGLTPSYNRLISKEGVRLPQKWEKERSKLNGKKSVRNYIQCGVIESLQDKPTLTVFVKRLERRGIRIWHREIQRDQKINHGLSYSFDPSLLSISFKEKSLVALVAGISEENIGRLNSQVPTETDHKYFGKVMGKLVVNQRGIPEFCLDGTVPEENLKPFSFRAANLGPFFQYNSIFEQLSVIDPETLGYITIKSRKKPTKDDYERKPLTESVKQLSKLILAAEIKSPQRVREALADDIHNKNLNWLDRECTKEELKFIQLVIKAQAHRKTEMEKSQSSTVEKYAQLIHQFRAITNSQPSSPTIKAIRLIAEENWKELKTMLDDTTQNNQYEKAPNPSIMYLGIPQSMSFTMIEYHLWFNNSQSQVVEDNNSAKRHKVQLDTQMLINSLINFDEHQVKAILMYREPDVSKIPLRYLGNVIDPQLAKVLRKLSGSPTRDETTLCTTKHNKELTDLSTELENTNHTKIEKGYDLS